MPQLAGDLGHGEGVDEIEEPLFERHPGMMAVALARQPV